MSLREFLDPVVNRFTRQTLLTVNRKHLFTNMLCIESFCPQKRTTERWWSVLHFQAPSPFWLLKPASEHARLLHRPMFLNRRVAARYRTLASIIPDPRLNRKKKITIYWAAVWQKLRTDLDCYEAGLCCYLVIHIENLRCTLKPFCFVAYLLTFPRRLAAGLQLASSLQLALWKITLLLVRLTLFMREGNLLPSSFVTLL
jgi:hypothetical protein